MLLPTMWPFRAIHFGAPNPLRVPLWLLAPSMLPEAATISRAAPAPSARAHVLNPKAPRVSRKIIAGVESVTVVVRILDAVRRTAVTAPAFTKPMDLLNRWMDHGPRDYNLARHRSVGKQKARGYGNN
jgi:hypothetical protein